MKIFAGRDLDDIDTASTYKWAAYSTQGLCAYYHLLEDPNLAPKDAARIHLLPGCIEHHEIQYRVVEDLREHHDSESPDWSGFVTRPSDRVNFIVQETTHSDKIGGTYRIQPDTSHVRNSRTPYSYRFSVCQVVAYAKTFLQIRCPGNDCSDPGVIKMGDEFGSPKKYNFCSCSPPCDAAEVSDEERSEEQPVSSQVPALGQQRQLSFGNRRKISLSVLISTFLHEDDTQQGNPLSNDAYNLKIQNFSLCGGIGGEGDSANLVTFARLYAELVHANRALEDTEDSCKFVLFGEFDDCAVCLIKSTIGHHRRILAKHGDNYYDSRLDINGALVRYLANGEEQSSTGFMLKPVVDEEARSLSAEPESSAPSEPILQEGGS